MEEQQFTPKIANQGNQDYYDPVPINPVISPESKKVGTGPASAYISPSKDQRKKEAEEALRQCPQEYPDKSKGPMPDYARFLTENDIKDGHIEQPVYEPPIFVPAHPPQSALTPGLPVRYDHYVEVGKPPARTSPSKLPPAY